MGQATYVRRHDRILIGLLFDSHHYQLVNNYDYDQSLASLYVSATLQPVIPCKTVRGRLPLKLDETVLRAVYKVLPQPVIQPRWQEELVS